MSESFPDQISTIKLEKLQNQKIQEQEEEMQRLVKVINDRIEGLVEITILSDREKSQIDCILKMCLLAVTTDIAEVIKPVDVIETVEQKRQGLSSKYKELSDNAQNGIEAEDYGNQTNKLWMLMYTLRMITDFLKKQM